MMNEKFSMSFSVIVIFGLIFGSFANALVWRLQSGESLLDRSMCPKCRAMIHWYDNVPVLSFLWLRGRCRTCHRSISWQYPFVELFMALGFVFVSHAASGLLVESADFWVTILFWCALWFVLIVIALFDWLYFEIPMIMVWIGLGIALLFEGWREQQLVTTGMWTLDDSRLIWGVLAGVGIFLMFTLISVGTKERMMGWGDAWLVLLLGLVGSWPGILWVVTLASGIGSVLGVGMMLIQQGTLKTKVPFAPLLILGFWLVVGAQLLGWGELVAFSGIGRIL